VVAREDVREALAAGAYLIEVPLIEQDSETVRANVSFERGILRAIDAAAGRRHQTRAAFLADAAMHEIERPFTRFDRESRSEKQPPAKMAGAVKTAAKKTAAKTVKSETGETIASKVVKGIKASHHASLGPGAVSKRTSSGRASRPASAKKSRS
jgi:HicB_like antitoxin of bacterial toxin-antitoxin system